MSKNGLLDGFDDLDKPEGGENVNESNESTEKTDEIKSFTQEDVDRLVLEAKASVKDTKPTNKDDALILLAESIAKQSAKSDADKYGVDGEKYVDVADIDPDDMLEVPIVFFCHSSGYVICDDKRKGVAVLNPYRKKKIEFKHHTTKRRGNTREQDIEYLSIYRCYSKKEAEWLRGHSFFRIKFFDNLDASVSGGHDRSIILHRIMMSIADWDPIKVRTESQRYGISSEMDLQDQRIRLSGHLADLNMEEDDNKRKGRVRDSLVDAHLK